MVNLFVPYSVKTVEGRFQVTSPKGKVWKTTYGSQAAAEKAIDYISSRFGGSLAVVPSNPPQVGGIVEPEHISDDDLINMVSKGERGAKTLMTLRNKEASF